MGGCDEFLYVDHYSVADFHQAGNGVYLSYGFDLDKNIILAYDNDDQLICIASDMDTGRTGGYN